MHDRADETEMRLGQSDTMYLCSGSCHHTAGDMIKMFGRLVCGLCCVRRVHGLATSTATLSIMTGGLAGDFTEIFKSIGCNCLGQGLHGRPLLSDDCSHHEISGVLLSEIPAGDFWDQFSNQVLDTGWAFLLL